MEMEIGTVESGNDMTVTEINDPSTEEGGDEDRDDLAVRGQTRKKRVKGRWLLEEDAILIELVSKFGARNWSLIARGIACRSGNSCRLRWCNQLDPAINRKPFTDEEDWMIISAHAVHGNKWAVIARLLPGRKDNAIKNNWNSTLRCQGMELGGIKSKSENMVEDASLDKSKASSEETVLCRG